jgi:hypothetical protein
MFRIGPHYSLRTDSNAAYAESQEQVFEAAGTVVFATFVIVGPAITSGTASSTPLTGAYRKSRCLEKRSRYPTSAASDAAQIRKFSGRDYKCQAAAVDRQALAW